MPSNLNDCSLIMAMLLFLLKDGKGGFQKVLFSLEEIAISPLVMPESISLALTGALEMPILVCKSVWSKLFQVFSSLLLALSRSALSLNSIFSSYTSLNRRIQKYYSLHILNACQHDCRIPLVMSVSFHTCLASFSLVQIFQNLPEASGPTTNWRPGLLIQKNSPIDTLRG